MKMKTIIRTTAVLFLTFMMGISATMAQRKIRGTVYRDGKPAAGVEVSAHKSKDSYFTSFDGKYELSIDDKSKYLKFTFPDTEEKLDIEGNTNDVIDFYLGGKPEGAAVTGAKGVDLRSHEELIKAKDKDYLSNLSMYNQFYKQKDYKSALTPWTHVYNKYPKSTENVYIHGVKIYRGLLDNAPDAEKDALFEKMMQIYDNRIKYFDQEGYNLGRKATDYLQYKLEVTQSDDELKTVYKTGYEWLNTSMEAMGDKTEAAVLVLLMKATDVLFKTGEFDSDKVLDIYEKASNIIEKNLAETPNDESYQIARTNVDKIFETSGAADCDALDRMYSAKFAADPDNVDLLKRMLLMLNRENCTESELYAKGAERLYKLDPSAGAARSMARLFLKRGDYQKASDYYQEAIDHETDPMEKATYLYEFSNLKFAQSDFRTARDLAKKSLSFNPNNGDAYILIGKIYAAASKTVSDKEFEQRMAFCLAVDYFNKAKSVDASKAVEANNLINQYSRYFPDKENAFFEGYSEGASYKVGGWINETTKIRVR